MTDVFVVLTMKVRPPEESDGLEYVEYNEEYQTKDGRRVDAVVDFGNGNVAPFTGYVDWYGDGGTEPSDVPGIMFAKLLGGS